MRLTIGVLCLCSTLGLGASKSADLLPSPYGTLEHSGPPARIISLGALFARTAARKPPAVTPAKPRHAFRWHRGSHWTYHLVRGRLHWRWHRWT